jgi:hypothetical protein
MGGYSNRTDVLSKGDIWTQILTQKWEQTSWCCFKEGQIWPCRPETGREACSRCLSQSEEGASGANACSQTSDLQNCKIENFCCQSHGTVF